MYVISLKMQFMRTGKKISVNTAVGYFKSNGNIHKKGRLLSFLFSFTEHIIKIKIFNY